MASPSDPSEQDDEGDLGNGDAGPGPAAEAEGDGRCLQGDQARADPDLRQDRHAVPVGQEQCHRQGHGHQQIGAHEEGVAERREHPLLGTRIVPEQVHAEVLTKRVEADDHRRGRQCPHQTQDLGLGLKMRGHHTEDHQISGDVGEGVGIPAWVDTPDSDALDGCEGDGDEIRNQNRAGRDVDGARRMQR